MAIVPTIKTLGCPSQKTLGVYLVGEIKMSKFGLNAFAVNTKAEESGIWSDVGDMSFLIARVGNDNWKSTYKDMERKAYGSLARKKDKRDAEKDVHMMLECLGRTCILDWKNVSLDGKEVKYSKEKSVEILTDKRFKPLAEHLLELAMDEERYMEDEIKQDIETVKN
jgi:hypothetical protein